MALQFHLTHPGTGQTVIVPVSGTRPILKRLRITVQMVADTAGVSRGTVSDTLNERDPANGGPRTVNPNIATAIADLLAGSVGGWAAVAALAGTVDPHPDTIINGQPVTPDPDTAPADAFPWGDVLFVLREFREKIGEGVVSAEAGIRKSLAVLDAYAAYIRAGVDPRPALAGAWQAAVVARELGPARDLAAELYRGRFRTSPRPPQTIGKNPLPPTIHPAALAAWPLAVAGLDQWWSGEAESHNAGAGKSWAARAIARLLERHDRNGQPTGETGRPVIVCPGSEGIEMLDFVGGWQLGIDRDSGATIQRWHDGFLLAAMRMGAVLIVEEPSTIRPGVFTTAHQPLEERDIYVIETGETVVAHPDFLMLCVDNTHGAGDGSYVDRHVMDPAFLDRFHTVEFGPLPEKIETRIVGDRAARLGLTIR